MSTALDTTLAALAEPSRRRVVSLLRDGPMRAGELAEALGASRPATSRHLRVLREAHVVAEVPDPTDRRGRIYSLRTAPLRDLETWLDEVQRFWDDQLTSFAALAAEEAG